MPDWSALEILDLIETGEITAREAFDAYVSATERLEPELRAFAHLDVEPGRTGFDERAKLPLRGLPVAVKDLFDTADMPTSYGSPIYAGWRPRADSALVARLRALGASVLGKTVTAEFATRHPGPTRNPHDPNRTPGGSSSGTAAAICAGMTPLGLGTQTAGSVIRPAAFCGIAGFKPSFGLLPLEGCKTMSWSLDTAGVLGRTLADCAWLFHLLRGAAPAPVPNAGAALRIGLVRTPHWAEASAETQEAVLAAARTLETAGAEITEVTLPEPLERLDEAHAAIMTFEGAAAFGWERATSAHLFSEEFAQLIADGLAVAPETHAAALRTASEARRAMDDLGQTFDLLLTPSAPGPAPLGLGNTGSPLFNRLWTGLHVPCATIPVTSAAPAPIGVQLVGFQNRDAEFLAHAVALEPLLRG